MLAAGAEILEKMSASNGEVEGLSEEGKMVAQDKDTLFGALNTAHDARISRLGPPDFDCFEVGERSLIGNGVAMYAHNFGSGALSFKPVTVGKDVRIFG